MGMKGCNEAKEKLFQCSFYTHDWPKKKKKIGNHTWHHWWVQKKALKWKVATVLGPCCNDFKIKLLECTVLSEFCMQHPWKDLYFKSNFIVHFTKSVAKTLTLLPPWRSSPVQSQHPPSLIIQTVLICCYFSALCGPRWVPCQVMFSFVRACCGCLWTVTTGATKLQPQLPQFFLSFSKNPIFAMSWQLWVFSYSTCERICDQMFKFQIDLCMACHHLQQHCSWGKPFVFFLKLSIKLL